jgi:23S rRNA-/tRNA-specific pseudouridylate synthase
MAHYKGPVTLSVRMKLQRECLYKNEHLLAINKWAGLVCQGVRPGVKTLGDRLLKVFGTFLSLC